jgi:hypothetical protein
MTPRAEYTDWGNHRLFISLFGNTSLFEHSRTICDTKVDRRVICMFLV